MEEESRKRLRAEMDARRFRVVLTRSDGSRNVIARGMPFHEAFSLHTRLILENGISSTELEHEETPPHVKASGADPDAPSESD